jgi:predicted nucleic acid-binding protein
MDIVADTNIFLAVALNEPERDRIIQLTLGSSVMAPEILPYEIGNALSAMVKRRKLAEVQALDAERAAGRIPVRLVGVDVRVSLRLAMEHNIYAYDAYFLQCARVFSRPLLTLDGRMKQVANQVGIVLLE